MKLDTYTTTGATGATFSGLPAGVTGSFSGGTVSIIGTPTVSGTFNYTVTLTGGCGNASANGTITVNPDNTIGLSSAAGTDNQTVCINTPISGITYTTTGATGATISGLPAGVTGSFSGGAVSISGTPTVSGTFNYTVTLTGGCGNVFAAGSITVNLCTGISELTACESIKIYPNPNKGIFVIENPYANHLDVDITDAAGRILTSRKIEPGKNEIRFEMASGIYFIRESKSRRMVKVMVE